MKRYRAGFTIIELLTVVAIILLLIAVLLPALGRARRQAKDVNASAHLHAIETAMEMFQNERGQYPSSNVEDMLYTDPTAEQTRVNEGWYNSGMHLVAEALVGKDQLGFDPKGIYDPTATGKRIGPLVKLGGAGATVDNDPNYTNLPMWGGTASPVATGALVFLDPSYGLPVLYYRASSGGQTSIAHPADNTRGYYRFEDNGMVTGDTEQANIKGWDFITQWTTQTEYAPHKINNPLPWQNFETYITNPKVGNPAVAPRPYNMDSFLLLSPGYDKMYGTHDDIRNWTVPK